MIASVKTLLAMDAEKTEEQSKDEQNFRDWLRIEVSIFIAYISASIILLLIRSCFRHQVHIGNPGIVEDHTRDFLDQNLSLFSLM